MKKILTQLFEHQTLSKDSAYEILINIAKGAYNNSQIASFLTVFMMRNVAVEELQGFRDALLDLCIKVDLKEFNTIDMCGTGGDGKDTFNISTCSSFVVAGAGYKVAKHGNYGVSSSCGSSNVMEYLGYKFTNDNDALKQQIDEVGICIMHAPLFHPAMKKVAPIRKELSVKTFFNMLGPLVNPSFPQQQLVGVFNLELARLYNYLLQESGKKYTILHSLDGYDEISLTGKFKALSNNSEQLLEPQDLGLQPLLQSDIYGGNDVKSAAKIFKNILNNKGTTAQNEVVIANSAMAIKCFDESKAIEYCVSEAKESMLSGRAKTALKKLVELC